MTTYDLGSARRTLLARRGLVALVVALLVATVAGAVVTARSVESQQRDRFDQQATRLDTALAERMRAYEQVLRGGLGLFVSSADVSRADWIRYVETLRLEERYPGFKSLSYAPLVRPGDLARFEARVRRLDARPTDEEPYTLSEPAGSSGTPRVHAPIRFVGPDTTVNRVVLGVDMMREPVRRATMERAAAEGVAVASPRLRLSGSASDEAGFIVYVPVLRDGVLQGWLTAAFLAEAFAEGLDVARATDLDVELRDGTGPAAALLHSTAGVGTDGGPLVLAGTADAPFAESRPVPVPGGTWSVRYVAPDDFVPGHLRLVPWLVLLLGLALTGVVVLLARGAERWRGVAVLLDRQSVSLRQAREEAEAATLATSTFLATMSHEIRTPLNAVLGAGSLLRETALDAEQASYAGVIDRSGQHLLHVVNDVLDLSKAEAGRVVLEQAPFDLEQCLDTVLDLLGSEARRGQVVLTAERTAPRHVLGDVARLRQVLLNLVGNAVKFTPAGGSVTVTAFPVPPAGSDLVGFEVADTGVGIAPGQLDALFDPYVQADASTTRVHGGTGLGLPIARRLVEAMGGTVTVASEPGIGTCFRFTVRLPQAPAAPPAPATAPAEAARLRVLVAEDDELSRDLLVVMLQRLGHDADAVDDGAAAVAAAERTAYDVVLLDQHMPGLDGVEAARRIRAQRDGAGPRIVAVSGAAGAFGDHADAEVAKPVVLDALAAVLPSAAGEGRADRGLQRGS